MAESEVLAEPIAHARISSADLTGAFRSAGIRNTAEVACVVLESTGTLSVIVRGPTLERALFASIRGAESLPAELFAGCSLPCNESAACSAYPCCPSIPRSSVISKEGCR
jgi:hypothetical protein